MLFLYVHKNLWSNDIKNERQAEVMYMYVYNMEGKPGTGIEREAAMGTGTNRT